MNLEELLNERRLLGDKHAKALAEKEYLDEYKKTILSICMSYFEEKHKSNAAQEKEARKHPDYIKHLRDYRLAVEEECKHRHHLRLIDHKIDCWRTKCANNRKEFTAYGN